jgi:stress response protein YsnF
VVREEIFISKRQIQETTHVEETVRREEVHLERVGNVHIAPSEVEDVPREAEREA